MRLIVCHELQLNSGPGFGLTRSGTLRPWLSPNNGGVPPIGARMTGFEGFGPLSDAVIYSHPNPSQLIGSRVSGVIEEAVQVHLPGRLNLLLLVIAWPAKPSTFVRDLQRPGTAASAGIFNTLGVTPNLAKNVYSTAVIVGDGTPTPGRDKAVDGCLEVQVSTKDDYLSFVSYRIACLLIGIERQLINSASMYLMNKRVSLFRVLRLRDAIIRWPELPAIDSTQFAKNYLALRNSLHLNNRRRDSLDALNTQAKRQELIIGGIGAFATLASLFASSWMN